MSLINLLIGLIFISAFLLILVIMVQEGKGGAKSVLGSDNQMLGGVKETTNFLIKFTWIMAIIFGSLVLISNSYLKPSIPSSSEEDVNENTDTSLPENE